MVVNACLLVMSFRITERIRIGRAGRVPSRGRYPWRISIGLQWAGSGMTVFAATVVRSGALAFASGGTVGTCAGVDLTIIVSPRG